MSIHVMFSSFNITYSSFNFSFLPLQVIFMLIQLYHPLEYSAVAHRFCYCFHFGIYLLSNSDSFFLSF